MARGQVKWFDPKKGYGFIVGPEGQDVFVHYSHIQSDGFRTLKDGEQVDYELAQGAKGWQARSVRSAEASGALPGGTAPASPGTTPGYEGADGTRPEATGRSGYEGAEGAPATAARPAGGGYEGTS